jgi:hypothetical protein
VGGMEICMVAVLKSVLIFHTPTIRLGKSDEIDVINALAKQKQKHS